MNPTLHGYPAPDRVLIRLSRTAPLDALPSDDQIRSNTDTLVVYRGEIAGTLTLQTNHRTPTTLLITDNNKAYIAPGDRGYIRDLRLQPLSFDAPYANTDEDRPTLLDEEERKRLQELADIRESKTRDPTTVHDTQTGLRAFESLTQEEVHPSAIPADERIEDLPAFLPDDHDQHVKSRKDSTTGSLDECDHCHAEDPWLFPLEKGVNALRPGGPRDGNPEFSSEHECPGEVKKCEECGCPLCATRSIRHRVTHVGTDKPTYACNRCDLEFDHPVSRLPDGDAERSRLIWRCECGGATRAPFSGIPEELLN